MTDLERALVALGRELAVPEPPDLWPAVAGQIAPRARARPRTRWAFAVAFALLAALAATLAIPEARSTLLRFLHVAGEEIELVDELPEVTAQPDLDYILGKRVSLAEARRTAGFDVRELDEPPAHVYLGEHETVWFLYGTPENVRLLIAQTPRRTLSPILFKKLVSPVTRIEYVSVDESLGVFLSGEPHIVLLTDERGEVVQESTRLARDVLVWSDGGVAFRLEGDFTREQALHLARSLR
jgi:hypothetical protein